MTKEKLGVRNNITKGSFKPPRVLVFGNDNGIPFRRAYRDVAAARRLTLKPGITEAKIVTLN